MLQANSSDLLTARQLSHASHDHRVGPPAVALKQMMHKRLTDPHYEPDLTRPEDLATSISPLELPTFENLVTTGVLPPGTLLSPVDPERSNTAAEVTEEGFIQVGEHLCETVDRAAREYHAEAGSGWEYWEAYLDGEDEPVTLAELRERALSTG